MKTETIDGVAALVPETPDETAAIDWVKDHPCFFAVATPYGISGFLAGVKHASPPVDFSKRAFVVYGRGTWGRGRTIGHAAENCRKAGATRTDEVNVRLILGDDNPGISGGGYLEHEAGSESILIGLGFKLSALLKVRAE